MIISWNMTNRCNLACKHCYRDSGNSCSPNELSTVEAKKLLREIARAGFKIMIFSGGEPLLREDIFELVAYANQLGMRSVLGTNGTLLTPDKIQALKKVGLRRIGISLDSVSPAKHDEFRGQVGAWEKTVQAMEDCVRLQLPFQVHTTVTTNNADELEELIDFAVTQHAIAHHFFFLVPTGRGEQIEQTSLHATAYEEALTRLLYKQQTTNIEIKPTCAPQFIRIAKQLGIKTRFQHGCLAGLAYCIINPSGKVQPCAYLQKEIGDIREKPFDEIWRTSTVLRELRSQEYIGKCGKCSYRTTCSGCRARAAFYHAGNYMAPEPWCTYREN